MAAGAGDDQAALVLFASRVVCDVDDGDVLVPVTGINAALVKAAKDAVQHIIDANPEFAAKVEAAGGWKMHLKASEMFARKIVNKPDRNPHKLLMCFIMAIHLYTQEWALYKELNACLRSRDRKKLLPFFPYLRLLLTAFSCIPPSAITVFRGVKKDLTGKFIKGEQAVWWSVTSTTSSMGTLQEEMFLGKTGKRTMFCIAAKTFRDVRHYSAIGLEAECCGLPGTCFDIDDLLDQGDLQMVQMSENTAGCMLDFAPDVAAYLALDPSGAAAAGLPTVFADSAPAAPPSLSSASGGAAAAPSPLPLLSLSHLSVPDVALIVRAAAHVILHAPFHCTGRCRARAQRLKRTPPPSSATASAATSSTCSTWTSSRSSWSPWALPQITSCCSKPPLPAGRRTPTLRLKLLLRPR